MITVRNISGSPESKPSKHFGVYSDMEFFYFFESKEEYDVFISSLPVIWDKETYMQQLNESHNLLFQSLYISKNYLSIGEIPLWFHNEEFGTEAKSLSDWWILTCGLVSEYLDGVTEQTIIENFIDTLPKL